MFSNKPYRFLFRKLKPDQFVQLFKNESRQMIIYVLSFCNKKEYINKVLNIFNDNLLIDMMAVYLNKVESEKINLVFVKYFEKVLKEKILEIERQKRMRQKSTLAFTLTQAASLAINIENKHFKYNNFYDGSIGTGTQPIAASQKPVNGGFTVLKRDDEE